MNYATLACRGPDAEKFLQGQLSCDMRTVKSDALSRGCYCNLKGRVIAAPYLYKFAEDFHLILPSDLAPRFMALLKKFIVFSKATLEDISREVPAIPVLSNPQFEIAPGVGFTLGQAEAAADQAWLARLIELGIPTIGLAQSELYLPHDLGLVKQGAVSFTKGCYVGQEIIARMEYKAKLKKQAVSWVGEGACPLEGEVVNEVIFEGKTYLLKISPLS